MKKIASLLFLLLLGASQVFSQAPKSSLLWEVSGNGLTKPSYIFGTFHLMCKEDFTISETLRSKLLSTNQFYGELKMDDPTMQQQMMQLLVMKDKTLESFMTPEDFIKVNEGFQKITGMPIRLFNQFKPFASLGTLYLSMISCPEKVQPETEFVKMAQANKLPILGLETVAEQMGAIDKQPLDSQIDGLKKMILNFDSSKAEVQGMINLYKSGDIDSIYNRMIKSESGLGQSMEKDLVITRNHTWVPLIKKIIAAKATFFAVGAGHLGGINGIINLLRKQGYKVTPIQF